MLLTSKSRKAGSKRSAVAAVELAVVLPFLTFIFVASVDFARLIHYSITIENCAHNGGIFGSQTMDNMNQQWIAGGPQYWQGPDGEMVSTQQAAADVDGKNMTPALTTSDIGAPVAGVDAFGKPTNSITINYKFKTLSNFPGIPSEFTITRTVVVRVAPALPGG